jgi:cardiolipin synthase A/B
MAEPEFIPWTSGNRLQLLSSGTEFFPALIAAINSSQHSIFLETYIFAKDPTTEGIVQALICAAQRGVSVHVLVDGFGARNFVDDFGAAFRHARVKFLVYRPVNFSWRLRRSRLKRLHRKLAVIDERIGFVGGINIIDDHNAPFYLAPRFDFAVEASGPVVQQLHQAAVREWAMVARSGFSANIKAKFHHVHNQWLTEYHRLQRYLRGAPSAMSKQGQVRFLPRDNVQHRHSIANAYLGAIDSAQEQVYLAHAYFLPGYRFRQALREASQRGVQITLILQGNSDHPLLHYATQALYGSLLKTGIQLYEYTGGFLHAKVGVVDHKWATVGSSNIDPFSLSLAHEGNLEICDAAFAGALREKLEATICSNAQQITLAQLKQAGQLSRGIRWMAYGLVTLLMALAGYGVHREMR